MTEEFLKSKIELSVFDLQQFLKILREVFTIFSKRLFYTFFKFAPISLAPIPYFLTILMIPLIFRGAFLFSVIDCIKNLGSILSKI